MEQDILRWIVEIGVVAVVLPLGVGGWRWARRTDRRVQDNAEKFVVIDEKLTHIVETLEKHDSHLEEVREKVASELGVNGLGMRDRLTRLEQRVEDLPDR